MAKSLTHSSILKLGAGRYTDGGSGLVLVVGADRSGRLKRRWFARVQIKGSGKRREMALGSLDELSLRDARLKAAEARSFARDGVDPIDRRDKSRRDRAKAKAQLRSFREVAEAHIQQHETSWKNAKHRQQWRNTLETYAYPHLGELNVSDIDTADVLKVLKPIWTTKPETAHRVRGRIETVINTAKVLGYREKPNPAVWRGHLAAVLPTRSKVQSTVHHPSISSERLPAFYRRLVEQPGVGAMALRFLILTAGRSAEVRDCAWAELDLDMKIWVLPASRMKANRAHRVPLSKSVLEILAEQFDREGTGLVFPNRAGNKPLSDGVFRALLKRMGEERITAHGFRATFKTWASEQTRHAREVIEGALAHRLGDQAELAYSRGDLLEKRRQLIADWDDFCCSGMSDA